MATDYAFGRQLVTDTSDVVTASGGKVVGKDHASRAWAQRFQARMKGTMPTAAQAAEYSSTLHYLRAVAAAGTTEGGAVMAQMRRLPIDDFFASNGHVLPNGLMAHDMYLMQVKSPAESKGPWDYYKLLATIPADRAFRSVADSTCRLLRR